MQEIGLMLPDPLLSGLRTKLLKYTVENAICSCNTQARRLAIVPHDDTAHFI